MRYRQVGTTGLAICELAFGGASIETVSEAEAETVLDFAWNEGVRHFDTAPHYGPGISEMRMGRFLAGRKRNQFTISTKVGRLLVPDTTGALQRRLDYTHDGIMRSVEESRRRTGLDRFDILLVHDIGTGRYGPNDERSHLADLFDSGWKALEDLRRTGDVDAIGIGVNAVEICLTAMERVALDIILLAGRYTLLDPEAETELLGLCARCHTSLLLGGVFNTGILATGAVPGALYQYKPAGPDMLEKTRRIEAVCAEFGVPLPAAALQFAKDHPLVPSILVATASAAQMADNLANYAFPIPPELWVRLAEHGLARHYTLDQ